jgi:CheY-like chemotaxis protein
MAGEKERCLEAGIDDNITKPIRPEQLVEVLNRYSLVTSTEEGR